jgi:hypothetical protein
VVLLIDHGHHFELRPTRCRIPLVTDDEYDDNWLVIGGEMTAREGSWPFCDPCLLVDGARVISR